MKTFAELKHNIKKESLLRGSGCKSISVALLGDTATQLLASAIRGEAVERGLVLDLFESEYNQVDRQMLDPTSDYHQHGAKYTIIFQSVHKLLELHSLARSEEKTSLAARRIASIRDYMEQLPEKSKLIYFTFPEIGDGVFGSYQTKVESSFLYQVRMLNVRLMELAQEYPNLFLCDLAEIQSKWGRNFFFDSSIYVSTEMVLSIDALPVVASRVLDIICAAEGKFKKCLILDLDNTLWGGVVGDDGWENIQIGHGLGIGKAFTEFQEWIRKLKERGILICVCSKNDEDKAKEPFLKNPEMVLKLEDIAVFVANWENKADNIRTIRQILNISFDSMVFLDDNPFERNMVREHIEGITVPELPEDPGDYLEFLYGLNLFETASYSSADKDRTSQYQTEAKRITEKLKFTNEGEFLQSLDMRSTVEGFTSFNIPRVAQLSQRSNQFNLRTVRYTEDEVRTMSADSEHYHCLSFTLEDKFGDNGLIAVIILEKRVTESKTPYLFVDTWLMSCRVLKRGMEDFTLNTIVDYARKSGYSRIIGEYIPTAKNGMVKNHYPMLGFSMDETGNSHSVYSLDVEKYKLRNCYIKPQ